MKRREEEEEEEKEEEVKMKCGGFELISVNVFLITDLSRLERISLVVG